MDRLYSAEKLGSVICSYVCTRTSLCRYKALIRTQLKTKYHFFPCALRSAELQEGWIWLRLAIVRSSLWASPTDQKCPLLLSGIHFSHQKSMQNVCLSSDCTIPAVTVAEEEGQLPQVLC